MELQVIQNKIYEIREHRVMLDFDLAELYGTETRILKQAIRRNIERFPDDFMFELTKEEYHSLRSQFVILKNGRGQHSKYTPFAFTEQGVAMLSSILNSKLAISINISIMRAFVATRQMLFNPPDRLQEIQKEIIELKEYIEEAFTDYNDINEDTRIQLELINEALAGLQVKDKLSNEPRKIIKGFNTK